MASSPLYSGSKYENAVYLAFGSIAALWVVTTMNSDVLSSLTDSLATIAFLGSILASFLFYLKPERAAPALVKRYVRSNEMEGLVAFATAHELCMESWTFAVTRRWIRPEEKVALSVSRVVDGPDLSHEMWGIKGFFYLSASIPLLLDSMGYDFSDAVFIGGVLSMWLLLVVLGNYSEISGRCADIAIHHILQNTLSVAARRGDEQHPTGPKFRGKSGSGSPYEKVVEYIGMMIANRDWKGCAQAVDDLVEEFLNGYPEVMRKMAPLFVEMWYYMNTTDDEIERERWATKTIVMHQVIRYVKEQNSIMTGWASLSGLAALNESDLSSDVTFFNTVADMNDVKGLPASRIGGYLAKSRASPSIDKIVLATLRLCGQYCNELAAELVQAGEHVSAPIRSSILRELRNAEVSYLTKIGPNMAQTLMDEKPDLSVPEMLAIIQSDSPEVVSSISPALNLKHQNVAEALAKRINSPNPGIVRVVRRCFSKGNGCEVLRSILNGTDSEARVAAVKVAGSILLGRPSHLVRESLFECQALLLSARQDPLAPVREAAIREAYLSGVSRDMETLRELMKQETDDNIKRMISKLTQELSITTQKKEREKSSSRHGRKGLQETGTTQPAG